MEETSGISVTCLPVIQICVLALGTLLSFITAYLRRDVTIYLPYISETGGWPPESCIFTMTIILGSFLGTLVIFVRYLVVADSSRDQTVLRMNKRAFLIGLVSWFGLAVVGAFPMSTVLAVHLVGAGVHFVLGLVYIFLQTAISHKTVPLGNKGRAIVNIRIGLCIALLVFLVFLVILFPIAQYNWKKVNGEMRPAQKIPEDSGFQMILASSFFEWALYSVFLGYFITFVAEFRDYRLVTSVQLSLKEKTSEDSVHNRDMVNYVT